MSFSDSVAGLEILYEDNHLIAVNKKPSQIVQGDKTGDKPLSEMVKEYLKSSCSKKGNVFLGVAHRLDRPVSGVVLFARTGKALSRLNRMFAEKKVEKNYWAIVKTLPTEKKGRLVHYLKKNQEKNISRAYEKKVSGSKEAVLDYLWKGSLEKYHLLEVIPHTGRHHQIRVQLSKIGCPIRGDVKYGFARPNGNGSVHLHARLIRFIHPVKKEQVEIRANPPNDPLWKTCLEIEDKAW